MSEVIQINPIVLGGGGGVSTDWFTKLWENPSPTATFASQTINLASGVYDFLLVTWKEAKGANLYKGEIIPKGASVRIEHTDNPSWNRDLTYVSDTSYSAGNNTQNNDYEVPYQIWGIQKNGLAGDVSTLASNCMLSNGDSVEDAITNSNFTHISSISDLTLTDAGSISKTISSLIGAKEIFFNGAYIGQQHFYAGFGSIDNGWAYDGGGSYQATGLIKLDTNTGAVTLTATTFPSVGNVSVTDIWYR